MSFITALLSMLFHIISGKQKSNRKPLDPAYEAERSKNYPPSFPNGWFNLCPSASVKCGEVKQVEAFGKQFAVFRGQDGKVGVLDIFCPHLNANLSDGKVVNNRLICPFHGWQFNQKGRCLHIPYSDNAPPEKARTRSYIIEENWGLILMWHHAEEASPTWSTVNYIPEIDSYKYHGYTSDKLHIHLQDFAENGADYAHFNFVHNLLTIPFSNYFVELKHNIKINFGKNENQHMAWFKDDAMLTWKKSGKAINNAGGNAVVTYFGPGFLAFKFNSRLAKDIVLLKTFTPLGRLKIRMEDHVFAPKGTNKFALKYVLRESAAQFHDDIVLWERKGFAKRPVLVQGDGPIMKMRKWYTQFYSTSSNREKPEEVQPENQLAEV